MMKKKANVFKDRKTGKSWFKLVEEGYPIENPINPGKEFTLEGEIEVMFIEKEDVGLLTFPKSETEA